MVRVKRSRSADGTREIVSPIVDKKAIPPVLAEGKPEFIEQRDDPKKLKPGKKAEISLLETHNFNVPATTGVHTLDTFDFVLGFKGRIVGMVCSPTDDNPGGAVVRGQWYAQVTLARGGTEVENDMFELGKGYMAERGGPHGAGSIPVEINDRIVVRMKAWAQTLVMRVRITYKTTEADNEAIAWEGTDEHSLSGRGWLYNRQLWNNATPASNLSTRLGNNGYRVIHAIQVVYFRSSAVAAVTMTLFIDGWLMPTVPTGFNDTTMFNWSLAGPALAADQDGIIIVSGSGQYVAVNDNTVITVIDNSSAASPLPLTALASDNQLVVRFQVTDFDGDDLFDMWVLNEEWIDFDA